MEHDEPRARPEPETIEVEAEPLPERDGETDAPGETVRLGPILAGLLLDLADYATEAMPRYVGLLVGAAAGWWIGGSLGLDLRRRVWAAAAGAAYCSLHGTRYLPLGTLVGTLSRMGVRFA